MSGETVHQSVEATIVKILEEWALMMVEREGETDVPPFDASRPVLIAELSFEGILHGTYRVLAQEEFATILTSNLLGSGEESSEEERADALREMTNVISGNLLTATFGADTVFRLSAPQSRTVNEPPRVSPSQGITFRFVADGAPVEVQCLVEGVR